MMTAAPSADALALLRYLGLPEDHSPSPQLQPIEFLNLYLPVLSQQHLAFFSDLPSPRQRTAVRLIKNRRTRFALESDSSTLRWEEGRNLEPYIWDSMHSGVPRSTELPPSRPGAHAGDQERAWADDSFVGYRAAGPSQSQPSTGTQKGYVGRLGDLLAEYEEEREAERIRTTRRERAAIAAMEKETEEEFDSDSDSSAEEGRTAEEMVESVDEIRKAFERVLRERFIDGLLNVSHSGLEYSPPSSIWTLFLQPLQCDLYDEVDFSDTWDPDDRDGEDRWFEDEEES